MIGLLDTNILIASANLGELPPDLTGFEDLRVSSLSYAELRMGIAATTELRQYRQREARLTEIIHVYGEGVPFDDQTAEAYGKILHLVADQSGNVKARNLDRMIAATALCHDYTLVTRNTKDFSDISTLLSVVHR